MIRSAWFDEARPRASDKKRSWMANLAVAGIVVFCAFETFLESGYSASGAVLGTIIFCIVAGLTVWLRCR